LLALNFHANLPKVLHIQELLHDLVYLLVIWGVSRSLELRQLWYLNEHWSTIY